MDSILGVIILAGYSTGFWFLKAASRGGFPREKFMNHTESIIAAYGIGVSGIILYAIYRVETILVLGGIAVGFCILFHYLEKHVADKIKISSAQFLGLFVLTLIVFFTIAAIVN